MEYRERRNQWMQDHPDSVLLLRSGDEKVRSNDTTYPYRPDSNLLYFTGFPEPEAVALLVPHHPEHRFVLFVRPRDREREIWDGRRHGPEGAIERFGADVAYPLDELDARLPDYLAGAAALHWKLGEDRAFDDRILGWLRRLGPSRTTPGRAPRAIVDPTTDIAERRMTKDVRELAAMREAARISAAAHLRGMEQTFPGQWEYQLQNVIEGHFRDQGASGPAYGSIVAGGANACILHYVENNQRLRNGDLVLVDAGAEFQWYAGDITRTWPVGRAFSAPQRDVYAAVLDVLVTITARVAPGASKHGLQQDTIRLLTERLVDLGLLQGSVDGLIEAEAYRRFFMHGIGHHLGIDVHDTGIYFDAPGVGRPFAPGVVFTVEPGLYIPDEDDIPEAFRGIGVRIEDDVLVTPDGCENLTDHVPKAIDEIEAIRRNASFPA